MKPVQRSEPPQRHVDPSPCIGLRHQYPRGSVLAVAGSDSGGGAGIQGDIKTITLLGGYASSVITCLTAQNTLGVSSVHVPPTCFFTQQLLSVLRDIPVDVIKTGVLYSAGIIRALSAVLRSVETKMLVVDPVMIAKGGRKLLEDEACTALVGELLPRCFLITPNIPEAELLTGMSITNEDMMIEAALLLQRMGPRNVLIKGGHMDGDEAVDILLDGNTLSRFSARRLFHNNTHGTGCTYASAIATLLAQGDTLVNAVGKAKLFVGAAIGHAYSIGAGHGPLNHVMAAQVLAKSAFTKQ